jgi:hypothetical protein
MSTARKARFIRFSFIRQTPDLPRQLETGTSTTPNKLKLAVTLRRCFGAHAAGVYIAVSSNSKLGLVLEIGGRLRGA